MLRQAAAVLVPLTTLLASKLGPVALLTVLGQGLAVTSTSDPGLLRVRSILVGRAVVGIINGTTSHITLHIGHTLVWETGRRRRKAVLPRDDTCSLGHCISSRRGVRNRHGGGDIGISKGSREGGNVGTRVRNRLSASHTVIGVEGAC